MASFACRALKQSLQSRTFHRCFSVCGSRLSAGRYFTKKHEWVTVNKGIGTVGISDHAQDALGDVVYVELPEVGKELKQGDAIGIIESVKAASDVYSPLSGKVVETNSEVDETPAVINQSAQDKGWLFKLEIKNEQELKSLMTEDAYEKFKLEEESH